MELTYTQFIIYALIAQAILGALLGLVPLIMGRSKGQKSLGIGGYFATLVCSIISPLLGLIVVIVFIVLINRRSA